MTKIYTVTAARKILANIAEGLTRLKEVEQRSLAAYLADWKTMAITERYLTQIVNYAIDVNRFAFHLAQVPAPDNYYDTFIELSRLKVLPTRLAKQLAGTTALRDEALRMLNKLDFLTLE